jgi:tetratricopeptide (TPR) repeat protein
VAAAAVALASVVAAVWFMASPPPSESLRPASASTVDRPPRQPAPASPVGGAQPVVASASGGASEGNTVPLKVTVQQLKDAGNWNVLVLHASKWTRDEPNNAVAWSELGLGYAKLRQFNDALVAATKAAELSPEDAQLWRSVGHLNLKLERLPEAGSAFDRALAADADDADALCGAALVAHRLGRTKDADALAKRVKPADGGCQGLSDGQSVTVLIGSAAATKPAASPRH